MSQDLGAVNAAPAKGITGHTVKLVPANLRSHEDRNIATLHNLRERSTIAKDIWQPDMTGLDTKFLLPEARPMHNLPDDRLARGKVTVRFNPHCTHWLKPSLRDTLFHPRIKFRNVLFQPLKHLWLALAIMEVGIALHQSQHIGDRMSNLLVGSPIRPHPHDIKIGMYHDSKLLAVGTRHA